VIKTESSRSSGLTLVEVVVVLVLVGLAYAFAAPSFLSPPRAPDDAMQRVINAARWVAVHRAGSVTLSFEPDGHWAIDGRPPGSARLLAGILTLPYPSPLRLRISPLGACMLNSAGALERSLIIDPIHCRVRAR
jgi:prepilin-type N-terminal cleavage/methylation domain-containing protein